MGMHRLKYLQSYLKESRFDPRVGASLIEEAGGGEDIIGMELRGRPLTDGYTLEQRLQKH